MSDNDFKFEITKELAVLSENGNYKKMVNLVSWNGKEPVLDVRMWHFAENETLRPLKGTTLTDEEAVKLMDVLIQLEQERG